MKVPDYEALQLAETTCIDKRDRICIDLARTSQEYMQADRERRQLAEVITFIRDIAHSRVCEVKT